MVHTSQKLKLFCLIFSYSAQRSKYRLFIGNPGTGKSTLANCIAQKRMFSSGICFGSGKTSQLQRESCKGITYLDTPGFADTKHRQVAANEITKALRKNGSYEIFFVLTLSSGRLRQQDVETIVLVLMHAVDIKSYFILVNKLSQRDHDNFETIKQEILSEITKFGGQAKKAYILPVLQNDQLDDSENRFVKIEPLNKWIEEASLWVEINSDRVKDIPVPFKSIENNPMNLIASSCTTSTSKSRNEADCRGVNVQCQIRTFFTCFFLMFY